jgi:hypothetical protein
MIAAAAQRRDTTYEAAHRREMYGAHSTDR